MPSLLELNPYPLLRMNPKDAATRNIKDKDVVTVFNDRGKMKCKVLLTEGIIPGGVHLAEGWWARHFYEGHHNELTHDTPTPSTASQGRLRYESNFPSYDVVVEVKKA